MKKIFFTSPLRHTEVPGELEGYELIIADHNELTTREAFLALAPELTGVVVIGHGPPIWRLNREVLSSQI